MTTKSIVGFAMGVFVVSGVVMGQKATATQQPTAPVTFHKDVLPVLQKNCQSCHRPGQIAPFSMLGYKETRPWARAIKTAVVSKVMPPWPADTKYGHFLNDRSLKQTDIDTLAAWADTGAVEGDPKDAPAPIQWPADNWNIKPDIVVDLAPYSVPAKGIMDWVNIAIPAPFKEDTWVTSMELLAGDRSVVHHMCFGFQKHQPTTVYNRYEWMEIPRDDAGLTEDKTAGFYRREGTIVTREVGSTEVKKSWGRPTVRGGADFCFLPGHEFEDYRFWGAGRLVPAGSDIMLTLHYTTNGKDTVDHTKIGFTVAKTPPAKKFVLMNTMGGDPTGPNGGRLAIPPYESDYLAPTINFTFQKDTELVWLNPHAHLRGKSAQYKLTYPDGREEIVLNVPRYDFNWQLSYHTSVKVPKGTKMYAEFRYDNSAKNKANPDPSKWVYEGEQTWEEMMNLNMGFIMPREADETGFTDRRGFPFAPVGG